MPQPVGLLVVGHGTRDAVGQSEFVAVVERMAADWSRGPVEGGYLEMASPTIGEAFERLIDRGARRVVVAPLLLFAAAHAKHDIPAAIREAASGRLDIKITQAQPLDRHEAIVELAIRRLPGDACAGAALVMVGRGARDDEALAAMRDLARRVFARSRAARLLVAFTDMGEPLVETALEMVAAGSESRVVIAPHLLFHGFLIERLHAQVSQARGRWRDKEWHLAQRLGADAAVARAAIDRANAALRA